ncbi:hypothetical protein Plhal304r1_c005g0020761 [Plasmopara halstedii]
MDLNDYGIYLCLATRACLVNLLCSPERSIKIISGSGTESNKLTFNFSFKIIKIDDFLLRLVDALAKEKGYTS